MSISDIDANTRGLGAFLKEKSVENCNHARPGREPGFGSDANHDPSRHSDYFAPRDTNVFVRPTCLKN